MSRMKKKQSTSSCEEEDGDGDVFRLSTTHGTYTYRHTMILYHLVALLNSTGSGTGTR